MTPPHSSPAPPLVGLSPPPVDPVDDRVPLRLTVARGALGMELYEPVEIGPLVVAQLSFTLPGLKFPLDLAGGVPSFRHRRGDLEHVRVELSLDRLGRWLHSRVGDVLGPLSSPPRAWGAPDGIAIGIASERSALCFELTWAPMLGSARFVVGRARGVGLDGPALGYALRAADTVLGNIFQRSGRVLSLPRVGARIGRVVLPAIGTRVPAAERVRFGSMVVTGDRVAVELDSTFLPAELGEVSARALSLADLCREADDALAAGDVEGARRAYVAALSSAPRHPELVKLVAEIDAAHGDRAEAALGMLHETVAVTEAGAFAAELLARTGELDAAAEAMRHSLNGEVYAPLAALGHLRLSELSPGARERRAALDEAVARAPGLFAVRWARFSERLGLGDVDAALADAEHLEAAALSARERHDVCLRAARALADRGFVRDAGRVYERALRYAPDDAAATAGLARALMEVGKSERAFALLSRAVTLSEESGRADADALIDMARLMARDLGDLPGAVARVRQVPASSARVVEARYLEATWRAAIGDLAGASLGYARLRDVIELADAPPEASVTWLGEAARFEREVVRDWVAAERHLAVALRIAPRDAHVAAAYREVAAALALRARREREPEPESNATHDTTPPEAEDTDERAERLSAALRADPDNLELAVELADTLLSLSRVEEAHAVLSARIEDATDAERERLRPRVRETLARLVERARDSGRLDEASLYQAELERSS
ncbi:MAG: tetratricopeptide repeat protein [Polyangiaceae bacterium]|nr:tetratricopeptide repeat protein [Polyangiaceae bacterium]